MPSKRVSARDRVLEASFECVARYGLAKTSVEDVARQAHLSRATIYRHFPGGKDQLIRETIIWESARFFGRLADAVAGLKQIDELLVEALVFSHRAVLEHAVLQKVLQTEPELLLPELTAESPRLLALITGFMRPSLSAVTLRPGVDVDAAADYVARLVLSFIGSPGRWDLTDRAQVTTLVRTELLAGVVA